MSGLPVSHIVCSATYSLANMMLLSDFIRSPLGSQSPYSSDLSTIFRYCYLL